MRILLTGGGTAGHINPAIAIANYIKEKNPGCEFLFVGTKRGLEKTLVPKSGYNIEYIDVLGLKRSLSVDNIKVFLKYIKSISDSKKIIADFKPDAVIGTGGYVCTPVIKAACAAKIPTLIHEQNVIPGLAIKMLAKNADITAISFDETKNMMKTKKTVLTGNPLRPNLFVPRDASQMRKAFCFDEKPVVLMFGGSLGAERMNDALVEMLAGEIKGFNLIAATGERHYEKIKNTLSERKISLESKRNVALVPYIYNMEEIFGACDLVVSRAGAITVSEITALGKAAVLIPSPYVAHNHQEYNARYLEKNGAAIVIKEDELSGKTLFSAIKKSLADNEKLKKMQDCSRAIGITDACETIYNEIIGLIK